jgi:Hemerythrin HHE cation binding domain
MGEKPQSAALHTFVEEHLELNRQIAELRKWWSELDELGLPKFGEMAFRVEELRNLLAEHFDEEERNGILDSAAKVAPEFAAQSARFQQEHHQFLDRLDRLIAEARLPQPPSALWRSARHEIEDVLSVLKQHEESENALVQAAYGNARSKR